MDERAELIRFGKQLRQVREQQGVSVADLAARSGINPQRIGKLEAGLLDPRYDVLLALARGMDVRASALIPDTGDERRGT
jgi:transcriptional regulator with XRE-family HTH domain